MKSTDESSRHSCFWFGSNLKISLKCMLFFQLLMSVSVCGYIYAFTVPAEVGRISAALATIPEGADSKLVHEVIADHLGSGGLQVNHVTIDAGLTSIIFDEFRLPRGYKAIVFYAEDNDALCFLSAIVVDRTGNPISNEVTSIK